MRHFGREFGGSFDGETGVHRTVDLGRTFRSVDQIAFAARTFVLRNPSQIDKKIVPAGTATRMFAWLEVFLLERMVRPQVTESMTRA